MDIHSLRKLAYLISKSNGGTVVEFAKQLELNPRQVKYHIETLRNVFDCPIRYDFSRKVYYYTEKGRCSLQWEKCKAEQVVEQISLSIRRLLGAMVLYMLNAFN